MSLNNYEDLMKAVETRRKDQLSLEVDLGSEYSQEYEDAKKALTTAEGMAAIAGGQKFLSDNIETLKAKVASLKPEGAPVWLKYSRLSLIEWAALVKTGGELTPVDQYEKVLKKTFIGVFNDPDAAEPLSDDPRLASSKGDLGILTGGAMQNVVQAFMSWQNSGGDVTIRPTKSGRV